MDAPERVRKYDKGSISGSLYRFRFLCNKWRVSTLKLPVSSAGSAYGVEYIWNCWQLGMGVRYLWFGVNTDSVPHNDCNSWRFPSRKICDDNTQDTCQTKNLGVDMVAWLQIERWGFVSSTLYRVFGVFKDFCKFWLLFYLKFYHSEL